MLFTYSNTFGQFRNCYFTWLLNCISSMFLVLSSFRLPLESLHKKLFSSWVRSRLIDRIAFVLPIFDFIFWSFFTCDICFPHLFYIYFINCKRKTKVYEFFQALETQEFGAVKWVEQASVGCKAGEEFVTETSEPFDTTSRRFRVHVLGTPVTEDGVSENRRKPQIGDIALFIDGWSLTRLNALFQLRCSAFHIRLPTFSSF